MTTARPRTPTPTRRPLFPPAHAHATSRPISDREAHGDPSDLAASLRELAARSHRAVRALKGPEVDAARRELSALQPRILDLRHRVDSRTQPDLASYLDALRREVESRLGSAH